MQEQAGVKLAVSKFRLEKKDAVTGEVFEVIEGNADGITNIWNKEQGNGTH